ncbi:general transcription factor 3C polypeptide 5 [Venturia canescens]|uniref:general transcription factor 3C polypeptide 5 n=1 Tax=Venturia canescens TaxID=32260 RepID=UPI001C9D3A12|nr:general transcription factor 3C polypeptide 5 [Venturia canescens]XP_043279586.1 general transcription factor 3C polypeptide 5 [Venturia canescens]XP_043279588.1 general transcription factor 3C polypeptide 5 [Venturia canescens]XP_043279589.1 general transcription factor 3C polypeptide 5 [Venturia canescens]
MELSDYEDGSDKDDEDFNINEHREDIDSDDSYESFDENDDEDADEEYTGPILPGGHRFDKKLLCIKYPGVVENPEKAIETLGGLGGISAACSSSNRRLELRFRPQDGYRKPTCGDKHETAGFLIRVRVKKSLVQHMEKMEMITERDNVKFHGPYDIEQLDQLLGPLGREFTSGENNTGETSENQKMQRPSCKAKTDVPEKNNYSESGSELNIQERGILYTKNSEKSVDHNSKDSIENGATKSFEDFSKDDSYQVPDAKVIGRVETEFDFQNLCDFQFLAIGKSVTDPKIVEDIYESVYPTEIPVHRWLQKKVPYFLPPPAFSRIDSVQHLSLKTEKDKGPKNVIGKTRKRLAGFSNFINFDSPETPCEPPPGIETALRIKFLQKSHLERIRRIFEERPVWSKNALTYVTEFSGEQLKFLLPSVAYYFMTGPWRTMWVKLGYDPRQDPQARKYQTLDYRLRAMHGLELTVNRKRTSSDYTLPYKSTPIIKPRATILTSMQDQREIGKKDQLLSECVYIYREGVVPPSRQMFYQYCDIHVSEIQEMLAKLPDHLPPGARCHEKHGWLPSGFSDQCREIINRQVRVVLRKQMNIPADHPTALPPKRVTKNHLRLSRLSTHILKNRAKKKRKKPQTPDEKIAESVEQTNKTNSSSPAS